ncbi:Cutinase gene palindrome-binding protein [Choanephora cucurbitarum]|uniref:Cutinase gene palindrome-binding protein n=1 Tax=Choanephora cucurbitarum TaxID=101091 RepID=A0A1C7NUH3_9FUNG|nr:Cutinase gene palindrome-binding protein [Choanephora cucurbitarum]
MQQPEYYSYILDNSKPLQTDDNNNIFNNLDLPTSQNLPQQPLLGESSSSSTNPQQQQQQQQLTSAKGTTDFRRRKNWSERILVEITGLLHVLSPTGKILYCSESTHELTGFRPHELVGQPLVDFLHVDDIDVFIRDFQMAFHMRSQIKTYYRFRRKDDSHVIFEVVGQPKSDHPGQAPQSFFGIAQPVPTRSGNLLDTFLELKTENNWLKKRIDELSAKYGPVNPQREEDSTMTNAPIALDPMSSHHRLSNTYPSSNNHSNTHHDSTHFSPPALPPSNSHHSNDSLNHMHTHIKSDPWLDSTDMDHHSFHTEDKHVSNPDQDMSADNLERKDKWKRRKKTKGSDEYVCADCGTTSSPEWRKGPQGPKTLCNACGLRWAKKNKKRDLNDD